MEVHTTPKPVKCLGGALSSSPTSPKLKPPVLAHSKNLQYSNLCTSISLVKPKTLDLVFKRKWFIHWHHIAVMLLTKYVCRRGVEHTNFNTSVEFCS